MMNRRKRPGLMGAIVGAVSAVTCSVFSALGVMPSSFGKAVVCWGVVGLVVGLVLAAVFELLLPSEAGKKESD